MKLNKDQFQDLANAINGAYNEANLKHMLTFQLTRSIDDYCAPGTMPHRVAELIMSAQNQGWLPDLLKAADQGSGDPGDANLKAVVKAIQTAFTSAPPVEARPGVEPYDHCFPNRRAFVNRINFRDRLRDLEPEGGSNVLKVSGDRITGKSYSIELIQHVADARKIKTVIVDIDDWSNPKNCTPDILMDEIADLMELETGERKELKDKIDDYAQGSRQSIDVHKCLVRLVNKRNQAHWFVFDSLHDRHIPDETRELIEELAKTADNSRFRNIRVILLDYRKAIPDIEHRVMTDKAGPIGRPEVNKFIKTVAKQCGAEIEDEAVDDVVESVFSLLPADPVKRMRELPTIVEQHVTDLFQA